MRVDWKSKLNRISTELSKLIKGQVNWTSDQLIDLEEDLIIGFYIIRKLIDGNQLTNELVSTRLLAKRYPNLASDVNILNIHLLHRHYDFQKPKEQKLTIGFLINQFIHSYIFHPVLELPHNKLKFTDLASQDVSDDEFLIYYENSKMNLYSILINSDRNRNLYIYEVPITLIVDLFKRVAECNPNTTEYIYNQQKKDFVVKRSNDDSFFDDIDF